jgi:hypothetical protein
LGTFAQPGLPMIKERGFVQKCGKIETPPWWNNVTAEYRDV